MCLGIAVRQSGIPGHGPAVWLREKQREIARGFLATDNERLLLDNSQDGLSSFADGISTLVNQIVYNSRALCAKRGGPPGASQDQGGFHDHR